MDDATVVGPGEGLSLDAFGTSLMVKVAAPETGGAYSLVEGTWDPGGYHPLPHRHIKEHESFYVLEGEFEFLLGADTVRVGPGALVQVPAGTLHSFWNAGDTPARLIFIHAPALDGFFVDLARLSETGPPEPSRLRALMEQWGMDVEVP